LRSSEQQQRSGPAAADAGQQQRDHQARWRAQVLQVGDGTGCQTGPQRNRVGRVGRHGGHP